MASLLIVDGGLQSDSRDIIIPLNICHGDGKIGCKWHSIRAVGGIEIVPYLQTIFLLTHWSAFEPVNTTHVIIRAR